MESASTIINKEIENILTLKGHMIQTDVIIIQIFRKLKQI